MLTILRHIDWTEGDGCRASIPTLARESQFSSKTLKGHLKYLMDQKISRRPKVARNGPTGALNRPEIASSTEEAMGEEVSGYIGRLVPALQLRRVEGDYPLAVFPLQDDVHVV